MNTEVKGKKVELIKEYDVNQLEPIWYKVEVDGRYVMTSITYNLDEAKENYAKVIENITKAKPQREVIQELTIHHLNEEG
tara:strand:- start:625 stop:864 length:240 start_codon:yes stop_codon:yes gene_type:complete